ncbi:ribbon-helix-helix domain-containing protein [Rhizobium sp. Root483D2]|jgi:antitoxin ParD1/3/4|uniref:ribbon-helix-helix domain-containing protein n=1 Tax=Rhizobium sp. Root483D2 TaxID=1736545 RepID=UPI00071588FE|nr:ribbon-helix-helix domain-containing protein [Rhizobium sp. Root483D2]KQY48760.1 CopG family transcriptional regulator [Rhizobium sp. Root483D2]
MVEKLSITLPSEMVDAIKSRVEAGSHASTSEVIREAMRTWLRLEEEHEKRLEVLRARVKHSLEDSRPNLTGQQVRARLDALYAKHNG